jgi:hypothetical protein
LCEHNNHHLSIVRFRREQRNSSLTIPYRARTTENYSTDKMTDPVFPTATFEADIAVEDAPPPQPSPDLEKLIKPPQTANALLYNAIMASPNLVTELNAAVASKSILGIKYGNGIYYTSQYIYVAPNELNSLSDPTTRPGRVSGARFQPKGGKEGRDCGDPDGSPCRSTPQRIQECRRSPVREGGKNSDYVTHRI